MIVSVSRKITFGEVTEGWSEGAKERLAYRWDLETRRHRAFEAQRRVDLKAWGLKRADIMRGLKMARGLPESVRFSKGQLLRQGGMGRLKVARRAAVQLKAAKARTIKSIGVQLKTTESQMAGVGARRNPYRLR